jgi:ribosomal protein L11 methyltransferase
MISLYLACGPEERDALIAELWERGTLGIVELPSGVRAWFATSGGLEDLADRYEGDLISEPDEDWVARTERSFPPLEIGQRFWLAPPWNRDEAPPGRMRLEMTPGMACGTGWHACTQMCLEAMERYVRPGASVLDVGVGSGILTVAARLLGAGRAIGCDIDSQAARIAREKIGGDVFLGGPNAVRSAAFDVVAANISASAIDVLFADLRRAAAPAGRLILSGFRRGEADYAGLEWDERDGWMCVVL